MENVLNFENSELLGRQFGPHNTKILQTDTRKIVSRWFKYQEWLWLGAISPAESKTD